MLHALFHLIFTKHKIPVGKVVNPRFSDLETVLEVKILGHVYIIRKMQSPTADLAVTSGLSPPPR